MKKKPTAYDPAKIEKKWQKKWASSKIYRSTESATKKKYYALDMFPYPSGEGLHVGHPKGYIATDVVSRMKRMQGMNVLHPMGFDAFGLPAENYAIKTKTHPEIAVKKNVERYKKQLELLGFDYDWSREVNTTDPGYYKWTQWIFLQLWKKGLAYESYEPINWCPSCKTGLANEDLDDGRCERCGTPVEKKPMRQWVLKITDYADRLLKDLDAHVMPNGDLFVTNEKGEPGLVHMNTDVPGRIRHDRPFEPRQAICAFVEHWSNGSFVVLRWKKVNWVTPITGGIEKGQTPEQAARAEIYEETGFKNLTLIKQGEGEYHSTFFHPPKDVNRIGHFKGFYFKLNGPERDDIVADEQAKHDVTWLPRDQVRAAMTAEGSKLAWDLLMHDRPLHERKPLLDWPESIKELQRNWIGRSEGAEIDFRLTLTKNKPRFVILHGWEGSADTNFLPWLKKELEKLGHEVQTPQLPNPNHPAEDEQVGYILKNCALDENTVLIGHSLGSVVAMKSLMKLDKPISGLVLIASAIEPGKVNYKEHPFHKKFNFDYDYEQIKRLASGRIAVLSDTQEKYRSAYLNYLSKQLDAAFIETKAEEEHFTALREPAILECVIPKVKVFTTRPDTIFGVTYIVLAPEHMWVQELLPKLENRKEVEVYINRAKNETEQERTDVTKEKTGVELRGIKAINPANGVEISVWIADYVLPDYGTGAIMAVPAHDDRDFHFAVKYELPIIGVIKRPADVEVFFITLHDEDKSAVAEGIRSHSRNSEAVAPTIRMYYVPRENAPKVLEIIQTNGVATEMDWKRITLGDSFVLRTKDGKSTLIFADVYTGDGKHINSDFLNGLDNSAAITKTIEWLGLNRAGNGKIVYKLRDWVFSRQRYWGEPIPLIHCEKCGIQPVPEKDLPVKLPKVESYEPTGTGESPLAAIDKWVNVKCPKCKGKGKRETNTMPQWAGSCWYYLRYEDPKNKKALVSVEKERYWSPVDLYVGGAEHATRHLIYARFWHKFLFDIGAVSSIEPFTKLQSVGLIMGEDGRKMGKRYSNIVNPDDIVATYGADTLRLYEMFMGPFDQQIAWNTSSMVGSRRFIERVWRMKERLNEKNIRIPESNFSRILNRTIKKVTEDIEALRFNTAISSLMICANELEKEQDICRSDYETYLRLLAPFAPHAAEELWNALGNKRSIHISEWPKYDPSLLADDTVKIVLQVNGKVRGSFDMPKDADKQALESAARALPEAVKWLQGKEIRKTVVVPGRLVNFVI